VKTELFCKASADSRRYVFHKIPKLVARFEEDGFIANDGTYSFELGIVGASSITMQVLFCTDDDSFLEGAGNQTDKLAFVQRTKAVNGEVWLSYPWTRIKGDFRLYALISTAGGTCYSLASTLCEALSVFYRCGRPLRQSLEELNLFLLIFRTLLSCD